MDNFKPCPFCGGEDVKVIAALDEEHCVDCWLEDLPSYGGKSSNYCVVCLKCQGNSGYRRTPQEAVDNWNRRPDGWIPVSERLPESGKHVLLCCEVRPAMKRYICDGYYAKAKSIINSCSFDYECAVEYDEEQDEYFLLEGFYEVIKNWDEYTSITIEDFVTHWMPMPEPPESGLEVRP